MHLTLQGCGFITDDVLAIERSADGLVAHPGANISAIRPAVRERLGEDALRRLGRELGHSVKTYVELPRESLPLPLDAIYYLTPSRDQGEIETGVEARELLASTFIPNLADPERLARLLHLCSEISSSVPLFRLPVVPDSNLAPAATMVLEHASATVGN
jgi:hypothetical protein